ncbi:hypothetical protein JOB18_028662 [Solea senegalensis]|uniref:Uncharacterized protein n=1 Tax=Solea senegalensis TaxID=28829 RepID=A0AAV6PR77_SOLSE|nr:hypothetical protein JOB18_028662 [Solea senegalensis]
MRQLLRSHCENDVVHQTMKQLTSYALHRVCSNRSVPTNVQKKAEVVEHFLYRERRNTPWRLRQCTCAFPAIRMLKLCGHTSRCLSRIISTLIIWHSASDTVCFILWWYRQPADHSP